jgi:CRP-like cAMP-binding protein
MLSFLKYRWSASLSYTKSAMTTNLLLSALPSKDRKRLLANCEQIELSFAEVLFRPGESIPHVYFPIESFISLVTPINGSAGLEVALVGNEGMLGISLILGIDITSLNAMVLKAGSTFRMTASSFLYELERSSALQQELKCYLYMFMNQIAQTAACTRFHALEARLGRWLLMAHDRAHSDYFHVTHEIMADILGVRRVGITNAANSLLKQKLISYHRGDIKIVDRIGLEAASCSCYWAEKDLDVNVTI